MPILHLAEKEIVLIGPNGPETYTLRMSWKAIAEIEERTNKSILSIVHGLGNGELSFTHAAIILQAGIRAGIEEGSGVRPLSFEGAGERIVNSGSSVILRKIGEFLMTTMTTPEEKENAEARAKKVGSGE
jgi:hypothetical protein